MVLAVPTSASSGPGTWYATKGTYTCTGWTGFVVEVRSMSCCVYMIAGPKSDDVIGNRSCYDCRQEACAAVDRMPQWVPL